MSKDDTAYVPLEIEALPSTTYYIHDDDEDFDEKVKEIIAAATALHPRVKVTV